MNKHALPLVAVSLLLPGFWWGCAQLLPAQVASASPTSPSEASTAPVASTTPAASKAVERPRSPGALAEAFGDLGTFVERLQIDELLNRTTPQQWLMALAAGALGLALGKGVAAILRWLGRRFEARGWTVWQQLIAGLSGPISLTLLTLGLTIGTLAFPGLGPISSSQGLGSFWEHTLLLLFSIAAIWYAYNLVAIIDVMVRRLATRTGSALDQQLAPMIRKTLRSFLLVIGLLYIVQNVFGQEIGTWLAGLGIAGLAVSLAAQDSLKNIFGSITILIDRPFRVGESIKYAGYDGTVEEIGFRSTKLRTAGGNLVTIPNSSIVNEAIENVGRRPYIRREFNVTITCDMPREKVQQAVAILQGILEEFGIREPIHPRIGSEVLVPRVYFNELNADSLNLQVVYWYAPPAWWDYLAHAQRVNLRILEEFEKAGIELAFPTQTLVLASDPNRRLAVDLPGRVPA